MSIIHRTNPLNLQSTLCLVTSASTPLGVVICKTLLKANALVLGVDDRPCDGELNAGLGTHFQFWDGSGDLGSVVGEKFDGRVGVDVVVGVGGVDGGMVRVMREGGGGGGSVVVVGDGVGGEELIDFTKSLAKQHEGTSIRTNLIVQEATISEGGHARQSGNAYEEAKTHMTALIKTERPGTQSKKEVPPKMYEVGNLVLFLAGCMSEDLSGKVFALDGSYRDL